MGKVLTKSKDILDEADRFQRILDWELFTMEQNNRLFGYNEEISWIPGDPIHDPDLATYVRPIIEELEDGERYAFMRCRDCQVDWAPTYSDSCWICGKEYHPDHPVYSSVNEVFYINFDGIVIDDFLRAMSAMSEAAIEMSQSIPTFRLPPLTKPKTNPFLQKEKDICLVEDFAPQLSPLNYPVRLDLPNEIDLSGKITPPVPEIEFSELDWEGIGYTPVTTINQQRRQF